MQHTQVAQYVPTGKVILSPVLPASLRLDEYNELLKTRKFWEWCPREYILVFQTDSIIFSASPHSINDFLQYSYIGAPWHVFNLLGGNGGFSLRRKSAMLQVIDQCHSTESQEDMWYSACLMQMAAAGSKSVKIPSKEEGKLFSVETIYYDKPFAIHAAWKWLSWDETKRLFQYCPELLLVAPKDVSARFLNEAR
jgi:hypothetical protein